MMWRIVYWLGSITTEVYIKASTKDEAISIFEKQKGKDRIITIERA